MAPQLSEPRASPCELSLPVPWARPTPGGWCASVRCQCIQAPLAFSQSISGPLEGGGLRVGGVPAGRLPEPSRQPYTLAGNCAGCGASNGMAQAATRCSLLPQRRQRPSFLHWVIQSLLRRPFLAGGGAVAGALCDS